MASALVNAALAAQVGHSVDAIPSHHPVLVPLVIDLSDMHEGLVVQSAPGIEAVVIAGNDVDVSGQQAFVARACACLPASRARTRNRASLSRPLPSLSRAVRGLARDKNLDLLSWTLILSQFTYAAAAA